MPHSGAKSRKPRLTDGDELGMRTGPTDLRDSKPQPPRDCVRHRIPRGRAGFLAFHVAPAAKLAARQIWWVSTVLATASGIAQIAFGRNLLLPQIIRAPYLTERSGVAPPSVASSLFPRCSIAVAAASWSTRGLLCGYFWNKQAEN